MTQWPQAVTVICAVLCIAIAVRPTSAQDTDTDSGIYTTQKLGSDLERRLDALESHVFGTVKTKDECLAEGNRLQARGDLKAAAEAFGNAIKLDPKCVNAWAWRAHCQLHQGQYAAAISDLTTAIELEPRKSQWRSGRGTAHSYNRDYGRATADLEAALELNHRNDEARVQLAYIYAACPESLYRNGKEALQLIEAVEVTDNESRCSLLEARAAALAEMGKFDLAMEVQREAIAIAIDAQSKDALRRQKVYESHKPFRMRERIVAASIVGDGHEFKPGDSVVCVRTCEMEGGKFPSSLMLAGQSGTVSEVKDGRVYCETTNAPSNCLVVEQDAVEFFRKQIEKDAGDVESRAALAIHLVDSDPSAALTEADEAARRHPMWLTLHHKAYVEWKCGKQQSALKTLDAAIHRFPEHMDLREARATCAINLLQYRRAVSDLDLVIANRGPSAEFLVARGTSLGQLKKFDKAFAAFDAAARLEPENRDIPVQKSWVFMAADRYDEALAGIDEVIKLNPDHADAHKMRGVIFSKLKAKDSLDDAIEAYTRCLDLDHNDAETYLARAACWLSKGEYDVALADASKAIELALSRADSPALPTETDASMSHFHLALARADFLVARAEIHAAMRHLNLALADVEEAIRLGPEDSRLPYLHAEIRCGQEDYVGALAELKSLRDKYPKSTRLRCELAEIYAACPDEKLRDGKQALKLVSDSYFWSFSVDKSIAQALAAAYAELGDFTHAVQVQRKALAKLTDEKDQRTARQRLELYEASKPYRLQAKALK